LLALGRPDFPTKINLGLAILKLAGMFLLVPRYGYLASASLLAGSYILGVSISALKVRSMVAQQQRATSQV
jgi:O-antigen/teichoic acid export membrane protein